MSDIKQIKPLEKMLEEELTLNIPRTHSTAPLQGMTATQAAAARANGVEGYEELNRIFAMAYNQAARGKGKERHSVAPVGFRPWHEQPILQIGRMVGPGYAAGQVQKKAQEAVTMVGNGAFEAAKAEVLGIMVYGAAMLKLIEEMEIAHPK